jgi:hypothetical protein
MVHLLGVGQTLVASKLTIQKARALPNSNTVYSFENLHFITLLVKVKYTDRNKIPIYVFLVKTSVKYNLSKYLLVASKLNVQKARALPNLRVYITSHFQVRNIKILVKTSIKLNN